ncbi:MAG: sugar phosphate isomerase/epimerase family protein, partial [Gemmataceae bacterium]
MPHQDASSLNRRSFVGLSATGGLAALAGAHSTNAEEDNPNADGDTEQNQPQRPRPTTFQVACMTLPYSRFPLQRALTGIKNAGFRYVAWGTTHMENGNRTPVMATDANPREARELGMRCRNMGLTPVMMFSTIYPEARNAVEVLTNRIRQAAAGQVPQVLTFGHTRGGNRRVWIERLRQLGRVAADNNVTLVVKQHGGTTGSGTVLAEIRKEVNHPNSKVKYDAGSV